MRFVNVSFFFSLHPDYLDLCFLHCAVLDGMGSREVPRLAGHLLSVIPPISDRGSADQGNITFLLLHKMFTS